MQRHKVNAWVPLAGKVRRGCNPDTHAHPGARYNTLTVSVGGASYMGDEKATSNAGRFLFTNHIQLLAGFRSP